MLVVSIKLHIVLVGESLHLLANLKLGGVSCTTKGLDSLMICRLTLSGVHVGSLRARMLNRDLNGVILGTEWVLDVALAREGA